MKQQTILYFGSFNPIHRGHLAIAEQVLAEHPDCALWFVVSPQSPFKTEQELAPEADRLRMAGLAVDETVQANPTLNKRLKVCDIEFHLPKPTRTIATLQALHERYPERNFILLIGSDNVDTFDRWKAYDEILRNYPVWVYARAGYVPKNEALAGRFTFLNGPLFPPVATDIRAQIARMGSVQSRETGAAKEEQQMHAFHLDEALPKAVWEYIQTHALYGFKA